MEPIPGDALPSQLRTLIPKVVLITQGMQRLIGRQASEVRDWAEYIHLIQVGLWLAYRDAGGVVEGDASFPWQAKSASLIDGARRYVRHHVAGKGSEFYDAVRRNPEARRGPGSLAWSAWSISNARLRRPVHHESGLPIGTFMVVLPQDESAHEADPTERQLQQLRQALNEFEFECLWQQWAEGRRQREIAVDIMQRNPIRYGGPSGFKRALNLVGKTSQRAMLKARRALGAAA